MNENRTRIAAALQRNHEAITEADALKEVAHAIGTYRGWRGRPETWRCGVLNMLRGTHRFRWGYEDQAVLAGVLGFDPAPVAELIGEGQAA